MCSNGIQDRNLFCVSVWSERRAEALFYRLNVPHCSTTAANLLTGSFHYTEGKRAQYRASHTSTHVCVRRMRTPGGLTWLYMECWSSASSCCQQPISTLFTWHYLDSPSFYSSPVKMCQWVCVCVSVQVLICLWYDNVSENKELAIWAARTEVQSNSDGCSYAEDLVSATLCLVNRLDLIPIMFAPPAVWSITDMILSMCSCSSREHLKEHLREYFEMFDSKIS